MGPIRARYLGSQPDFADTKPDYARPKPHFATSKPDSVVILVILNYIELQNLAWF